MEIKRKYKVPENKLTKEIAEFKLKYIEHIVNIDETEDAHLIEDDLYLWFIDNIASNKYDSKEEIIEIANILKQTQYINYPRYYS